MRCCQHCLCPCNLITWRTHSIRCKNIDVLPHTNTYIRLEIIKLFGNLQKIWQVTKTASVTFMMMSRIIHLYCNISCQFLILMTFRQLLRFYFHQETNCRHFTKSKLFDIMISNNFQLNVFELLGCL